MTYTHLIHLGDIHIRCGDEGSSRFKEYTDVFQELKDALEALPCIQRHTAMIVVCGDIFHNKYKLEAYSILLWNAFIQMLTEMAPTVVICGNHDYRQEDPDTPDLIDVMFKAYRPTGFPCHYLKDTGTYVFKNIEFGLVCIKDTLNAFNTHGLVETLPDFPAPSHSECHSVALFHGTITQSALPNGQRMTAGKGYPLEWFKGYSMLLLGDNHKQQIHTSPWGLRWGYPGSLVQQDIGEPVKEHGFLLWDLETQSAVAHTIYNPCGRMKLKWNDGVLCAKLQPIASEPYVPLEPLLCEPWFPKTPHFVWVGSVADEWNVLETLKTLNVSYQSFQTSSTVQASSGSSLASVSELLDSIHHLNNPRMWLEYIQSKDSVVGETIQAEKWMEEPKRLMVECVPEAVSKELYELTGKYRHKMEQLIQHYEETTHSIRLQRHTVVLKQMSWGWVYSYGAKNHFEFDALNGKIGLLKGKNASGKSAFIDALCIGMFGEPSLNRQLNQTKRMSSHCIHHQRPKGTKVEAMNVKILMDVDNVTYELERSYQQSVTYKESSSIAMHLYRVDKETNERVLLKSGSILVNEWVRQHIGTIEDLMKTSIVSQMDNNNFFFAKPEEQKAMIDSAVNLKELQAFGELIHECLLHYQMLLKTVGTILQSTEESDSVMSEEERMEKETRLKELSQQSVWLESQKNARLASIYSLVNEGMEPGAEETKAYWESQRPTDPDWAMKLADCRDRLAVATNDVRMYGVCGGSEDVVETIEPLEKKLRKHLAKKPPSSRSKTLLLQELDIHRQWVDAHREWMDAIDSHEERLESTKHVLETLEHAYEHWVKNEPKRPAFLSKKSPNREAEADWEVRGEEYRRLYECFQEREGLSNTLEPAYAKVHFPNWLQRKETYDEWVMECQQNEWTNQDHLEENRLRTRTYLEKRRQLNQTVVALETQVKDIRETLQTHGDWKVQYDAWQRKHEWAQVFDTETLNRQMCLLESCEREKTTIEAQLEGISSDPWWNEWKQWKKKYDRCVKYAWESVSSVKGQLTEYENEKQRVLTAQTALETCEKERTTLLNGNPHSECTVCQNRLSELESQMQMSKKQLGSLTLDKLDEWIVYYQKGLVAIQWVETFKESMLSKYERYERERVTYTHRLDELKTEVVALPTLEAIRDELRRRVSDTENEKYKWLQSLEEKQTVIRKQWKKHKHKLDGMQSEEQLIETEQYWEHALDVFTKMSYQTPLMEREGKAWKRAEEIWGKLEALPEVPVETLETAWWNARNAWVVAGETLKRRREETKNLLEGMVSFQSDWDDHLHQTQRLQTELEWAETMIQWDEMRMDLEKRCAQTRYRLCEREWTEWERYEMAEKWVQWYEYREYQRDWDTVQLQCQELREQLAIDDYHRPDGGVGWGGSEGGGGGIRNRRGILKNYQSQWSHVLTLLTVLDKYLVGEKGKQTKKRIGGGGGGEDGAEADTFKEWVYQHHVLPMLEAHINDFLQTVGIDLKFHIEYGKKSLNYIVKDRGNETSFAASSGFQQFIIGLAMRHALSSVGGIGNNLRHLFIDEGFTACDSENLEKAYEILNVLIQKGHYKSILMISHLESIQAMVPLKILLERKGCFTSLTFGNAYPVFKNSVKRIGRPPKNKRIE